MHEQGWRRWWSTTMGLIALLGCAGGMIHAGVLTSVQPIGGTWFTAFAIHPTDPNTIYFGMDDSGGIYKSTDGGQSLQYVSGNLPNITGWTIAIDPANPNRVYAGDVYGRGVVQSTDNGGTWAYINNGLTPTTPYYGRAVAKLALDPSSPGRLLAYTFDGLYTLDTTNPSSAWVKRAKPPDVPVTDASGNPDTSDLLLMAVHSSGRLFVGSRLGKLYTAPDATQPWTLAATFGPDEVSDIEVDPVTENLFVMTHASSGMATLRRSTDLGTSWSVLLSEPSLGFAKFAVRDNAMYLGTFGLGSAGVRRSLDYGSTWDTIGTGIDKPFAIAMAINPTNPSQVLLGCADNGYRTSNATAPAAQVTWTKSNYGLQYTTVNYGAIVIDPANPSHVLVTAIGLYDIPGIGGIFQSFDGGTTWAQMTGYSAGFWSLDMAPGNPQQLLGGSWTQGVKRSTDGGATWSGTGLWFGLIYQVAFGGNAQTAFAAVSNQGVYKSTDGGVTWALKLSLSACNNLAVAPTNPAIVYATGYNGIQPIFKSTDGGETWSGNGPWFVTGDGLAIDPQNAQNVYLGTWFNGVWRSTNGGSGWARLDSGWGGIVQTIVPVSLSSLYAGVVTQDSSPLYIASPTPGYFRSNDSGVSWAELTADYRPTTSIPQANLTPGNPKKSYVILNGLYRYTSGDLFNYAPSSTTILQGSLNSGSAASLATSNNSYYVVNSTTSGATRFTDWYGSVTLTQAPSSISTLGLTYQGKYSASGKTQALYLFAWPSSTWTQIDTRTVGTSKVTIASLQKSPGNFISPTGQVRFRVLGSGGGGTNFRASGDYMLFTAETTPVVAKRGASIFSQAASDATSESLEIVPRDQDEGESDERVGKVDAHQPHPSDRAALRQSIIARVVGRRLGH